MTLLGADLLTGLVALAPYAAIAASLLVQGFFSGSETGAYRVNRVRLRLALDQGRPGAWCLSRLLADMPGLICVTLIGTNIAVYVPTFLATRLFEHGGESSLWGEMMATLVLTPIMFVFAEVLPKNIYNAEADRLMVGSARALYVLRRLFGAIGLVALLKGISGLWTWVGRLRRGDAAAEASPFAAQTRLRSIIRDSAAEGIMTPYQNELVEKIMSLRDVHVGDAMVPTHRVVALGQGAGLAEFLEVVRAHRFSRLPLVDASGDNVVGITAVNDVLAAAGLSPDVRPADFARPAVVLSPAMTVTQAIFALQRNRAPMAIVRSPHGRYIGIVTLKDLVEEIVGELEAW